MKKLLLLLPIAACNIETNLAEAMVKGQVATAKCTAIVKKEGVAYAVCAMPDKSEILSVHSAKLGWKAYTLVESPSKAASTPSPEAQPTGEGSGYKSGKP